ncbi:6-carboxytetrahydropterin synthase [Clostridium neuense]|uniref:6-carboxy-5,6,7,8-tetrahydropterin synthase n=1 Tax=Clostridium neuense TaxID=1728934 RepID=A0ABW8TG06_9CLOT
MKYNQYRFKFYLNASHSIYLKGTLGQEHPHTWEIILNTVKLKSNFIIFNDIEKSIEKYLTKYQDSYLNNVEPFITLNPTLENICEYLKNEFQKLLFENGWLLLSMEISETPTRSYIIDISDEADYNKIFEEEDADSSDLDIMDENAKKQIESIKESI